MKLSRILDAARAVDRAVIAASNLGASRADTQPLRDAAEIMMEVRHMAQCLADENPINTPRYSMASNEIETRFAEFIRRALWEGKES